MVEVVAGVVAALAVGWLALVLVLVAVRPRDLTPAEAAGLVPELVRTVRRIAADRRVPRRVRLRAWLLVVYLASPVDLVPDVVPLIGLADDVIVAAVVLRSIVCRAGPAVLEQHWQGPPAGLTMLRRLAGIAGG